MKWMTVRAVVAAVAMALAGSVVSGVPASAAVQRHFVLISTHGAPLWKATAVLQLDTGVRVYQWNQSQRSGGRALWYFNWGGDRGWIDIELTSRQFEEPYISVTRRRLWLDRDHCLLVEAFGANRYTGDSLTGGCNSR